MGLPVIAPYPLPAEAPAPRAPWRPDRARMALLVHDMQRYFCAPYDGAADPLRTALANIAALAGAGVDDAIRADLDARLEAMEAEIAEGS